MDLDEDEDQEYDFRGDSSESGASTAGSVAGDDDMDDSVQDLESCEDPFGFFDAAAAEANSKQDEVATGEDDKHCEVPGEEPSVSSSSDAAPGLKGKKEPVFIDVEDDSVTCGYCEVPKVLCKCRQIAQLKQQLNALKVQRRARIECHDPGSSLSNMQFFMYEHIHMCDYIYIYIYTHGHVQAHVHVFWFRDTHTHRYIHMKTNTCIYISLFCEYVWNSIYIYIYTHTDLHINKISTIFCTY